MSAYQNYTAASGMSVDDTEWNRTFKRPAPGSVPPVDRDPPAPAWSPITTPATSPRPSLPASPVSPSEFSAHGARLVDDLHKGRPGEERDQDKVDDHDSEAWTTQEADHGRKRAHDEGDHHSKFSRPYPGPYVDILGPPYPSPYHDIDDPTLPFGPNHITSARDLYGLAISAKVRKITADRQQFLATHYGLGCARDRDSRRPLDAFLNEVAAISSYEGSDTFSHIKDLDVRDTIMAFSKVPWDERMAFVNAMRGPAHAEETDDPARPSFPREFGGDISTAYRDTALPALQSSARPRADHEEQYLARVRALVDPARKRSPDEDKRRTAVINAWAQREAMKMNEEVEEEEEVRPTPAKRARRRRKNW